MSSLHCRLATKINSIKDVFLRILQTSFLLKTQMKSNNYVKYNGCLKYVTSARKGPKNRNSTFSILDLEGALSMKY